MSMKLSESWRVTGRCIKLGIAAASFLALAGCSQFASLSSQLPVMTLQMDARYVNGTDYDKALMLYEKGLLIEAREKARAVTKRDAEYREARRLIAAVNNVILQISRKHMDLAENYERAGIYKKAVAEYKKSLDYDPSNLNLSRRVAVLEEAIREGRQPDIESMGITEMRDDMKAEKKPEKKKERSKAEDREHKANLHYTKGKYYLYARAYAKAVEEFDLALSYVPAYMNAEELLAVSEGERVKAVERHLRKGINYFQVEEMEFAIKEWEIVLQYDPDNKTARDYKYRAEVILERLKNIREKQQAAGALGQPL